MEKDNGMKINRKLVILALILLISLLLICKLSNYWYASNTISKNNFANDFAITGTIPLKYNDIYYYGDLNKIPCGNKQIDLSGQAQIPCIMRKKCPDIEDAEESKLSANDIALLYSEAYKMAGKEVLNRAITEND